MSKKVSLYLLLWLFFSFFCTFSLKAENNENINILISFSTNRLKRGEPNKLIIKFKLNSGYYLNYYPLLSIQLKEYPGLNFSKDSFKMNEIDVELLNIGKKKYVNTNRPIVIPFEVLKDFKRGKYVLKIVFEGFITNINEKYAIKFVNPVEKEYRIY